MGISAANFNVIPTTSEKQVSSSDDVLKQDDFLQLLVTQLRYQNPSDPMSNEQFIAQSAQFSSLEQMSALNASVKELLELQKSSSGTAALNLIGKQVSVEQTSLSLLNGSPVELSYSLSADANAAIAIFGSDGESVRTMDLGEQFSGARTAIWDGLNDEGIKMPDGEYTYKVSGADEDGNEVEASEIISGIVDSVLFEDEPYLSIGGVSVPLRNVVEASLDTPQD